LKKFISTILDRKKNATKGLAAIAKLAFEVIPGDPTRNDYRQGTTLGDNYKHWFRAKFFQQYRLLFRNNSIIYGSKSMNYLVIGYGNTLRSDDGAGQIVADRIASWNLPNLRSLAVHQLTPELAEDLANTDIVIFVDAVISSKQNSEKIEIQHLECNRNYSNSGHTANPRSLLYLSKIVYNRSPLAYWILIPAINFEFGEKISSLTQQGIAQTLLAIEQIIDRTTNNLLSANHA
jgi:hydrogenase maturation protease